ncbi:hypothetical protein GQ55_8G005200 [Panicum hallii var. hallii]|uniref:Uncharacterized protein n=1 Tax=Panicum hallii var. hallii TaxID=1504633 RepID=A0A2T7CJ78_9POAL|nr:hypothetical protein GQ55_8G005200 [Panicum hallii var. hallii]
MPHERSCKGNDVFICPLLGLVHGATPRDSSEKNHMCKATSRNAMAQQLG